MGFVHRNLAILAQILKLLVTQYLFLHYSINIGKNLILYSIRARAIKINNPHDMLIKRIILSSLCLWFHVLHY